MNHSKGMTNFVIGVDPGMTGAVAYFKILQDASLELIGCRDVPIMKASGKGNEIDPYELAGLFRPFEGITRMVYVERQQSMPGQSAPATFKAGRTYQAILQCCGCYRLPMKLLTPKSWKSKLGLSKDKNLSRSTAVYKWPNHADLFKRVKDADRAEAALVAHVGYYLVDKFTSSDVKVV